MELASNGQQGRLLCSQHRRSHPYLLTHTHTHLPTYLSNPAPPRTCPAPTSQTPHLPTPRLPTPQDRRTAGSFFADARRGHLSLGRHLLAARPISVYGARYLAAHLIRAGSEPAALDKALQVRGGVGWEVGGRGGCGGRGGGGWYIPAQTTPNH